MGVATDIELKKDIDKYLAMMKNGKRIGKFVPEIETPKKNLSGEEVNEIIKSLTGIIKGNYNLTEEKEIFLRKKYGIAD